MDKQFKERMQMLVGDYEQLLKRENKKLESLHGLYHRYLHPVLTTAHVPLTWQYDFNPDTNPRLLLRNGINSVLNAGAIKWNDRYLLMARVEGYDRKSFLVLQKAPMELTILYSGIRRPLYQKQTSLIPIYMISVWWHTKTAGYMDCFVQSAAPKTCPRPISHLL